MVYNDAKSKIILYSVMKIFPFESNYRSVVRFQIKHLMMTLHKYVILWLNSPGPLTDNWKVTDDSSVNFHDVFFFIFCQIIAKNEEKHVMEIYG